MDRNTRFVTAAALVSLLLARPAAAQTPPALGDVSRVVRPGDHIVVLTADGTRISGQAETLTAAALGVRTRAGLQTIPAERIGRLVVKDSLKNGVLIGTATGASVGLVSGLFINLICESESGGCPGAVLMLTAMGAGAGAVAGAGIDGLLHRTVFDALPGVRGEFLPHVAVGLATTRTTPWGIGAVNGPPSVGLSWGMQHTSNFGLELDINRTIGDSTRTLSCATAPATTSSRLGCTGEGRQGLEDATTVSGKLQYFFSRSRVQPYIAGGVGIHHSTVWRTQVTPRFRTPDTELREYLSTDVGLAWVGGAGARIGLTERVWLRPDVTVYKAADWTHLRAGVGVGVSW
jgi:outer membrane protein W